MRHTPGNQLRHEEGSWMQRTFKEHTQSFVEIINHTGNPFLHDNARLLRLDTRDVLDESVVTTAAGARLVS